MTTGRIDQVAIVALAQALLNQQHYYHATTPRQRSLSSVKKSKSARAFPSRKGLFETINDV